MESSTMYSPPVAESFSRWESRDRYYCRYRGQGNDEEQGGFRVSEAVAHQFVVGPSGEKRSEDFHLPKVYRRKKGPAAEKVQAGACAEDDQVVVSVSTSTRVCSDCNTSRTPLWRNGPAGPKSLCNACGIRYRKRGKTGFTVVQMASNALTEERPREETPLFLLQRRFAGTEEAKAAEMLMALSCGFPVRS
ncbi:hypothetical protein H6P81_008953 [Aristolochia fimbriata]|uniref:GATA-type domain-containing protein n=1 Tax=Aristolochia fimbriata TaxID=158543 RepID=A0AAV7EJG8_ARIFI|nr:hypothetical protein H6P81_008953 [Aristolochia fimbriata]